MPICNHCGKEWTWKQTMKTLSRLKCPQCNNKQYESASSKKKTSIIGLIPVIALPINVFLNNPWWMVVIIMIPMIAVVLCVYPFMIKVSNEEEPLW
ncbi:TIGR04104 family putative zinc finger protein [Fredinandcohnia onubensis]|uniref:TIGR04104 family putative zinc finger protein n=1 Tax=Fredinandcohnia onubensis TaxID=1571209 RepID=UPI000C0BE21F|nr:TIGR04104 family putative zinc finger protein [Fredinandcohnia onubensis]